MSTQRSRYSPAQQGEHGGNGNSRTKMVTDWAVHQVEEQPLSSLCAVFAAGFIIGAGAVSSYCATQSRSRTRSLDNFTDRVADAVMRALPSQLTQSWR